ncbi:MAG TPA: tetraacyldisaccharide 4'-kinase [Planctomycetota bacterium]|nr:tetraacyldisaccharide 4'-kinase [Planctomycetota bacterium]
MKFIRQVWFMAVHQNPKGLFWWEVRLVLRALSFFYYIGIKLRLLFYWLGIFRSYKLPAYVISVGNLTVGGTGKTPFVLYLAEKLSKSCKVGILARGYGRKSKIPLNPPLSKGETGGFINDDEDITLSNSVIRVANPDRVSAGEKLIKEQGVQTIILDDGFQHLALRRDVDIVLIDATNPFGKGRLMPAGILREPLASLKRADIFVLTHVDLVTPEQLNMLEEKLKRYNKKIVKAIHKPQYLVDMAHSDKTIDLSEIKDKPVWEFCGIGNPFQFHKTLNTLCTVKGLSIFPDHYYYSQPDLQTMFLKAKMEKAETFVTTEKDALRLKGVTIPAGIPCYYLKIKIEIIQGEDVIGSLEQRA